MNKLTYRQAYDLIIEAYFKDEIEPFVANFCFCGTLSGNKMDWSNSGYSREELVEMESALIGPFPGVRYNDYQSMRAKTHEFISEYIESLKKSTYEDFLFSGMSAALDVLKEIHRSRGENVDEDIPAFTKRELVKAL